MCRFIAEAQRRAGQEVVPRLARREANRIYHGRSILVCGLPMPMWQWSTPCIPELLRQTFEKATREAFPVVSGGLFSGSRIYNGPCFPSTSRAISAQCAPQRSTRHPRATRHATKFGVEFWLPATTPPLCLEQLVTLPRCNIPSSA